MNANAINTNNTNNNNGINLVAIAEQFGQYFIQNIAGISIVVVVLIGALVYAQIMHVQQGVDITENVNMNADSGKPPAGRTVVVETFDTMTQDQGQDQGQDQAQPTESLDSKLRAGFCKSHLGKPAELETACGKLSKHSCTATSCCTWAKINSVESCVSGNRHGPIFKHGPDGTPKTLDHYYFENKCKGNCPTANN
jgi:hypothetical protein